MTAPQQALTERQRDLITRAHLDCQGLIEPLLDLKGGAKIRMLTSLAQRGLIEQVDGQWRLTRAAVAIVKGEAPPADAGSAALPEAYPIPTFLKQTATPTDSPSDASARIENDPEIEAAVSAAEASWQSARHDAAQRHLKRGIEGKPKHRPDSKQAQVIEMLKRPEGATIAQISEATGWQHHTVRGTFAGALKKKLGLTIVSEKVADASDTSGGSQRRYRIVEATAA